MTSFLLVLLTIAAAILSTAAENFAITDWGTGDTEHQPIFVSKKDNLVVIWSQDAEGVLLVNVDQNPISCNYDNTINASSKLLGSVSPLTINVTTLVSEPNSTFIGTMSKSNADLTEINNYWTFRLVSKSRCPTETIDIYVLQPKNKVEVQKEHETKSAGVYFLVAGLLLFSMILSYALERLHFLAIPESGVTILVGAVASLIITSMTHQKVVTFDPSMFFFVLLPAIIFESGYTFHKRNFFPNFGTIFLFAFVGCLLSTFIVGIILFCINKISIFSSGWSLFQCFIFGCLISATDPVATLSVFSHFKVNVTLYGLVFGESVMNDAVALVLFRVLSQFEESAFTFAQIPKVLGLFLLTFLGSTVLGIAMAILVTAIFKFTGMGRSHSVEIVLLLIMGYFAYSFADLLALSGIVSIFFYGATTRHYCWHNISIESQNTSLLIFKALADVAEASVFLYLGLSIFPIQQGYNLWMILFGLIACFLGRAANIFPLAFVANCFRSNKITMNMQYMMFHAGLRGAVAYALASNFDPDGTNGIKSTAQVIVLFTVFVLGGTTAPMLEYLELNEDSPPRRARGSLDDDIQMGSMYDDSTSTSDDDELIIGNLAASQSMSSESNQSLNSAASIPYTSSEQLSLPKSKIAAWMRQFDNSVLIPFLTKKPVSSNADNLDFLPQFLRPNRDARYTRINNGEEDDLGQTDNLNDHVLFEGNYDDENDENNNNNDDDDDDDVHMLREE